MYEANLGTSFSSHYNEALEQTLFYNGEGRCVLCNLEVFLLLLRMWHNMSLKNAPTVLFCSKNGWHDTFYHVYIYICIWSNESENKEEDPQKKWS